LAGSLDRAVDVAATLELRGYSLEAPTRRSKLGSRFDGRFYLAGALVLAAAIVAKALGADDFHAYPTVQLGIGPATVALSALLVLGGLAPFRRKPKRNPVRPAAVPLGGSGV
ncbi:MAG TPA: hypothetical protein VIH47_06485, partial [Solirubrobacterales bacterium]